MGLLELATIERTYVDNRNRGPGQTVYAEVKGLAGAGANLELYGPPGFFSRPGKGTRLVTVPLGRGNNYRIAIAAHNYRVVVDWTAEGDTTLFSTNAAGDTVKARIDLRADGNIYLNGTSKYLVTWGSLNLALGGLVTAINAALATKLNGSGSAGALTLDLEAAKATTLRTDG